MTSIDTVTRRACLQQLAALTMTSPTQLSGQPLEGGNEQHAISLKDDKRTLRPSGSDLGSLFKEVEKLTDPPRYALTASGSDLKSLLEAQKKSRGRILDLVGYRPSKIDPSPECVERVDCDVYTREKVIFSTGPHLRVPAYVLVPRKLKRPAPAIIDLHSHGGMFLFGKEKVVDLGKNHPVMEGYHKSNYDGQPTATALVRRGYVVITIDAFFFGERRLILDEDLKYGWDRAFYSKEDVQHLNQKCRAKEATLVKTLTLGGLTWPGIVFWDDMRTVDYVASRKEVDAKRIGCLGISMGGYRSAFLTALDERIKAACVVGFMSTVAPMKKAHIDTHSWVHFLPGLHRLLDLPDVASLGCPRPLLVQQCSRDRLFPLGAMKEAVKRIANVYASVGKQGAFQGRFHDVPHQFTRKMQLEAFTWLDSHLKG